MLTDDEWDDLLRICGEARIDVADKGLRNLLLRSVDRAVWQVLPVYDSNRAQLESDLAELGRFSLVVSDNGRDQVPLEEYLAGLQQVLDPREQAKDVERIRAAVARQVRSVVELHRQLLTAVEGAGVPVHDVAERAGLSADGFLGFLHKRHVRSAWALMLDVAARAGRLDELLSAVGASADDPGWDPLLRRKGEWETFLLRTCHARLELVERSIESVRWSTLREVSSQTTRTAIAGLTGRIGMSPPTYDPGCHVPRRFVDQQIAKLGRSEAKALVLAGDAGVGLTSSLVHSAQELERAGHVVVFVRGGRLGRADPWTAVARALGVEPSRSLSDVGEKAAREGKLVYVFVDGVGQAAGPTSAPELFTAIDGGLDRLPSTCNVVLSFSLPAWRRTSRVRGTAMHMGHYLRPPPSRDDPAFVVEGFDDRELAEAWPRYQAAYGIPTSLGELSPQMRRLVAHPSMMCVAAETFRGQPIPAFGRDAEIALFRRFVEARTDLGVRQFLRDVALVAFEHGAMPVPYSTLRRDPRLASDMDADGDSRFSRMVHAGVLRHVDDAPHPATSDLIEFTNARFGAYVLADAIVEDRDDLRSATTPVADRLAELPFLVEAFRLILGWRRPWPRSVDDLVHLAGHRNPLVRDTVAEYLAAQHVADSVGTRTVIDRLLRCAGEMRRERQRTGLRAAYLVAHHDSEGLHDVFVRVAGSRDPHLRQQAHDLLFLLAEQDPDFVFGPDGVMMRIARQVSQRRPLRANRLVGFLLDLSISLYTVRPGWTIGRPISELFHKIAGDVDDGGRRGWIKWARLRVWERIFKVAGRRTFTRRVIEGYSVTEASSLRRFLALPDDEKRRFRAAIHLLDPAAPFDPSAVDSLRSLLSTDHDPCRILAGQILAVRSLTDPSLARHAADHLWDRLDQTGRLWLLSSFATCLEETPAEWIAVVESLTERMAETHRELLVRLDGGVIERIGADQLLYPLGLAYACRGTDMPVIHQFLCRGLDDRAVVQVRRCLRAMGAIGVHAPRMVLRELRTVWNELDERAKTDDAIRSDLVGALGTIRSIHFNDVDNFLYDVRATTTTMYDVLHAADDSMTSSRRRLMALYGNGVHQAAFFPKMREELLVMIYESLASGRSQREVEKNVTRRTWDLFREADFQLEKWAGPLDPPDSDPT